MSPSDSTPALNQRGCFCRPSEEGAGEAFCGTCQVCGKPGHVRHFPGALPYTGAWCDAHFSRVKWFDPRASLGCLLWFFLAFAGLMGFFVARC